MLDDLGEEDAAERLVLEHFDVAQRIALLDGEALAAGVSDHVGVGVDAARVDPGVAQEAEKLTAAAADVEHGLETAEVVHIWTLAPAYILGRPPHTASEGEVVGNRVRPGLKGD